MTVRTLAQLESVLADNTSGDISPDDVRSIPQSIKQPHGSIYMVTPAATSIVTPGTYYKAAGTTAASDGTSAYEFTLGTNNRLTYTGATTKHAHLVCSLSMTCASNNQILGFAIARDGVVLQHSLLRRKVGTGADVGAVALHADCALAPNDYLELFVTNDTSTAAVTVTKMYLFAVAMFM